MTPTSLEAPKCCEMQLPCAFGAVFCSPHPVPFCIYWRTEARAKILLFYNCQQPPGYAHFYTVLSTHYKNNFGVEITIPIHVFSGQDQREESLASCFLSNLPPVLTLKLNPGPSPYLHPDQLQIAHHLSLQHPLHVPSEAQPLGTEHEVGHSDIGRQPALARCQKAS